MAYKDPKQQNEYRKERYQNDPVFRERVRELDKRDKEKRYKEGKTWGQRNPEKQRLYYRGYRSGLMRARKAVCPCCRWRIDKLMGNKNPRFDKK